MKLILSNTAHDAYRSVLDCLRRRLPEGGEHIVIVPDKFTASSERGVLETLGLDAAFNVSVTSFTRLAEKTVGRKIKRCLTPQGSVMLLAKVIEEKRDLLVCYGKAAGAVGFAEEFYAALTAVRNSGITPAELRSAANRAGNGLRGKLKDLSLIYDAYLGALAGRHSDSSTRLEFFADALEGGLVMPYHFYVVDFYDFKAPELRILAGLSRTALSLTVGLVSGFSNPNRRIYCDNVARTLERLTEGTERSVSTEELHPVLQAISERLFSYERAEKPVENDGKVRLLRTPTVADEVKNVVTEIVGKVRGGARYRDFEVVLVTPDTYKDRLKAAFLRYGVPFFIDTREPLAEQTKVRYLLSAIATARSNFGRADVLDLVKNPLFLATYPVEEDDVFVFENYCLRFNVDRSRFRTPFSLGDDDVRARAEKVREALCEALLPFADFGEKRADGFVACVRAFLDGAEEAWRAHSARLTELSLYYAKCAEQVDEKTKEVLDEIEYALDAEGNLAYFERILQSMIGSVKIALVPTFLDAVFVGDTHSRYLGRGDIYILGATVGSLPAAREGGAVITSADEEALADIGAEIKPSRKSRLYLELMEIVEIMKRPRGELVISYPRTSAGGEQRASTVVTEISSMIRENGGALEVRDVDCDGTDRLKGVEREKRLSALYATPEACAYEILRGLRGGGDAEARGAALKFLSEAGRGRLERVYERSERPSSVSPSDGNETVTSASRLERFFVCPYQYFFAYRAGLRKRREAGMESTDSGLLLHYVVEKLFRQISAGRISRDNIEQKTREIFARAVEEEPSLAVMKDDPATARRLGRLADESVRTARALYEIYLRSEYKPRYIEAAIGGEEIAPLIADDGDSRVKVVGRVDRVDEKDGRFVVVDYKTYKNAGLSMSDIFLGKRIQLYLYADAIAASKGWKPSGVFYMPLYTRFADDSAVRFKYQGHVTADVSEATKIDSVFAEDPAGSALPYKLSRNAPSPSVHLTDEDFRQVGEYVRALAADGASRIRGGDISPDYAAGACKGCDFADICAYSGNGGRRAPTSVRTGDLKPENIPSVWSHSSRGEEEEDAE